MAETPWWTNWDLSYTDNVYGPVYGGHSVQESVYNTLKTWLPAYIMEANRQLGGDVLQIVKEYRHRPEYRTLPKDVQCAILVTVPGTAKTPRIFQDSIRVDWKAEIHAFVYGTKDWQETEALTAAYAAVIRACIVQHRDLDGFAETTKWIRESYYEGEHSATRTTGMAKIDFEVTVGNVTTPFGGPPLPQFAPTGTITDPTLLPPANVPTVSTVESTINNVYKSEEQQ